MRRDLPPAPPDRRRPSRGFTLVELMAVILIIGVLSSMLLLALAQATQTAKAARTRSLITKINNMLMARWDSYRTMRLPITAEAAAGSAQFSAANEQHRYRANVARRRLFAMRELLRMEMPDRYEDITSFTPSVLVMAGTDPPVPHRPYLWQVYRRKMAAAKAARANTKDLSDAEFIDYVSQDHEAAECLYLILTSGIDDSSVAADHFLTTDFGDKDKDGMYEFHDAWENPIQFLRWAPGHESPMQPVFRYPIGDPDDTRAAYFHANQYVDPDNPNVKVSRWQLKINDVVVANMSSLGNSNGKVVKRLLAIDQDDPFNPLRVGPQVDAADAARSSRWRPGDPPPENGFILFPLIYSSGPDGEPGINHYFKEPTPVSAPSQGGLNGNAYLSDPYALYNDTTSPDNVIFRGYRGCSDGNGGEFDNITNQQTISE